MIAAADAGRRKRAGDLIGPRVQLRVGEALVAADERLGVGPAPRVLLEDGGQVQHGSDQMGARAIEGPFAHVTENTSRYDLSDTPMVR